MLDWAKGPYGEILSPPLWEGVTLNDAINGLVEDSGINNLPRPGSKQFKGICNLSLIHKHQKNLIKAISGRGSSPIELALFVDVLSNGQPLSLRPVTMERLRFKTFTPVFRRSKESLSEWHVGHGDRLTIIQASPENAIKKALRLYAEWSSGEASSLKAHMEKKLPDQTVSHLIWESELLRYGITHIAPGYWVYQLGKHGNYYLHGLSGDVLFKASSPQRAALMTSVVMKQTVSTPDFKSAVTAIGFLGGIKPEFNNNGWLMGDIAAYPAKGSEITLTQKKNKMQSILKKNDGTVVLIVKTPTKKNGTVRRVFIPPATWPSDQQLFISLMWASRWM